MGKPIGFLEYDRMTSRTVTPKVQVKDFHEFYTPLSEAEQREQGVRCTECKMPFCQSGMTIKGTTSGCPFNNLISEWNDLIFRGNQGQAYKQLKETNSFPEFTCRICPASCEAACTCGLHRESVSIRENEIAIIERAYAGGVTVANPPGVRTDKKMAVVGSGSAGLAIVNQLDKREHGVTVYERSDKIGGLLMYGIPNIKLEKHIIERKIAVMKEEGVTFVAGTSIGVNYKVKQVMKGYDNVILACGVSNPRSIAVPGRDGGGIHFTVDFLTTTTGSLLDSNLEDGRHISARDKHVIVTGDGDTDNDCVGTAIHHGCASVAQLEMMSKLPDERAGDSNWPEWPRVCKADHGQEEATAVLEAGPWTYQTTVKGLKKDKDGCTSSAVIVSLTPKREPESGRIAMAPVEDDEKEIPIDLVLTVAGFLGAQIYVAEAFGVELSGRTNVATKEHSYRTNVGWAFIAGNVHCGQSLVVWTIREGREAVREVDEIPMRYSNLA